MGKVLGCPFGRTAERHTGKHGQFPEDAFGFNAEKIEKCAKYLQKLFLSALEEKELIEVLVFSRKTIKSLK